MNDKELIEQLIKTIHIELGHCNDKLWPRLCEMRTTEQGMRKIEEMVIRMVADEGMPVGSALALIEQELAHMEE